MRSAGCGVWLGCLFGVRIVVWCGGCLCCGVCGVFVCVANVCALVCCFVVCVVVGGCVFRFVVVVLMVCGVW